MRNKIHRIEANDLTHYVSDSGSEAAPAAILLHGFPDSSAVWDKVTPLLVDTGFRIIAPDLRGFGETDMAARKPDYEINAGAIPDILKIIEVLKIDKAHIVGHDFGAPVAWSLAAQYPEKFATLTAMSVGHPRAFLMGGRRQALMSWYILFHQLRGICEAAYRFNDWMFLRRHWAALSDVEGAIANLSRPGRLTAGLNWYRANLSFARMIRQPEWGAYGEETVRIPTLGLWSDGEKYLAEKQMMASRKFVEAPWRYERIEGASHWIPADKPEKCAELLIGHWRSVA